jgi:hypothetical protein
LTEKQEFRVMTRGPYADVYDRADKRFDENIELHERRQQIVEHAFGTVKRTMGGGYFPLRTFEKVKCETALLFLGYNLKRAVNVLGFDVMTAKLDEYAGKIASRAKYGALFSLFSPINFVVSIVFFLKRGFSGRRRQAAL